MGWASGSELAEEIWNEVKKYVPKNRRKTVARNIIDMFESYDCDTMYECEELCEAAEVSFEEDEDELL